MVGLYKSRSFSDGRGIGRELGGGPYGTTKYIVFHCQDFFHLCTCFHLCISYYFTKTLGCSGNILNAIWARIFCFIKKYTPPIANDWPLFLLNQL